MRVYQLIRVSGRRPTVTSGHRTARRKPWDDLERIMRMVSSAIPIITFRYDPYKRKKLTFWVSLFCDSVGIRTQDPQLRRLLLYPAELPNHPAYSAGKKGRAGESDCKYRYFLLFGNVFSAESFFWLQNSYNICRKYGILVI